MKIIHANILTDGQSFKDYTIEINGTKITAVTPTRTPSADPSITFEQLKAFHDSCLDLRHTVIDMEGKDFICPGFIDMHNHGAMMADAMDGTFEALDTIARYHAEHGVTTFLPTTMTASSASYETIFHLLDTFTPSVPVSIPGLHMEGPYLSKAAAGAQPTEFLLTPTDENLNFLKKFHHHIKYMTISPDVPDIERLLDFCHDHGIIVSGGHDSAIDTEIYRAIDHHMACVTHIYCCSSTISRRNSPQKHLGLTEIGLSSPQLSCEVIADNCHIPLPLFELIYKCKGYRKICLVSDSIRATGMAPGQYFLGNATDGTLVDVTEDVALLPGQNLFAGSITPICKMVENLVSQGHYPLEEVTYMASSAQADLLHLESKGQIKAGFDAQLNIIDSQGKLLATLIHDHYQHFNF